MIFMKNMDDESFNFVDKSLQKTLTLHHQAMFASSFEIKTRQESCKLKMVMKTKGYPEALGLQKNSPYQKFISRAISRLQYAGVLSFLQNHHSNSFLEPKCELEKDSSINFLKVVSLFIVWISGALFSIGILFLEKISSKTFKKSGEMKANSNGRIIHVGTKTILANKKIGKK